jgi:hypothetical protein
LGSSGGAHAHAILELHCDAAQNMTANRLKLGKSGQIYYFARIFKTTSDLAPAQSM